TGQSGLNFIVNMVYGLNTYYTSLDASLKAAEGDPWAMMDVAIVANDFRETYFELHNIAERAFGAAECVGSARGNFMISLMDCVTSGVRDQTIAAAGCVAGCAFAGPAMPVCLATCGVVTGVGNSVADMGCILGAVGTYSQNIGSCLNK
ncbi:MAG: hypothetical protein WC476_08260, partial [Phycisphaerae bacterium]